MHENVGHLSETVAVPVNCIGLIIGKNGDMVKQIADRTNTRIQVQKDDQLDAQYVAVRVYWCAGWYRVVFLCLRKSWVLVCVVRELLCEVRVGLQCRSSGARARAPL